MVAFLFKAAVAVAAKIGTAILGTALAATLGATVTAIVGAVVVVGTVALATRAIKRARQRKLAEAGAAGAGAGGSTIASALVTKTGSSVPIPLVYGQRRISGQRVFIGSDGDQNKYIHVLESLCEGPIEGMTAIYFNDQLVATSSDNGATWDWDPAVEEGDTDYTDNAAALFRDGSQTTALDTETLTLDGDTVNIHADWRGSTKVGNDTAYIYMVLKWDQEKFGGGLPNVTYLVKGKKVPAIGSDWNSTLSYSNEPARVLYDYLINPNYGKGIPYTLIDAASFNASATYNSEQVDATSTDSTQTTRYTCNAYVDTAQPLLENVEDFLTTIRGGLITGDKYQLIQDKPRSTSGVVHIDDDRIIGSIKYLQASKKTLMNALRAKFPDSADPFNYQENITIVESPVLQSASYDNVKLKQDLELPYTIDRNMVDRILTEEINQSRQSGILEIIIDPSNIDLTVGDVVKFSNETLGQTEKFYRITKTILKPDHTLELNMREYDDNVYWDNNKDIIVNNKNDTDH
jgi:hypothetical protein